MVVGHDNVKTVSLRLGYFFNGGCSRIDSNDKRRARLIYGAKRRGVKPITLFRSVGNIIIHFCADRSQIPVKHDNGRYAIHVIITVNGYLFPVRNRLSYACRRLIHIGKQKRVVQVCYIYIKKGLYARFIRQPTVIQHTGNGFAKAELFPYQGNSHFVLFFYQPFNH